MACVLFYNNLSVTGDCSNTSSGAFSLDIFGEAPDYTIQWISPSYGTIPLGAGVTAYTVNSLSAGTYTFNITDSCLSGTTTTLVNVYISSGTSINIDGIKGTTCNLSNGAITASTTTNYISTSFELYETTLGYITSGTSLTNNIVFDNLSSGIYYFVANDGAGCDGKSEACIIPSSTTLSFGLYAVNNAGCNGNTGAIYVTGLTGSPPYTYLWSNSSTDSFLTGLTEGFYTLQITDNSGCATSGGISVLKVPQVGLGYFIKTAPTCFGPDGELTVVVTGGTAPYYYSLSNGDSYISFSTSHTFTGLSSGNYTVDVTDAGLCSFTATENLLTPNLFYVSSVDITNSNCNNSDGEISIIFFATPGTYTFTLTGVGQTTQIENISVISDILVNQKFSNLSSGVYTLTIENSALPGCNFTQSYTISNVDKFQLSAQTTGTTCNFSNGSVLISVSSGATPPFDYTIGPQSNFDTGQTDVLFENLPSGSYVASVVDADGCEQSLPFIIPSSYDVNFILNGINPTIGNNGSISVLIVDGEPPFTLNWSTNVNGQTGLTINNLSAGTYTLSVTDNNGCSQERQVNLTGFINVSSYQVINVCDTTFQNTDLIIKGPKQMLIEGFHDLTINDVNCVLVQSIFSAEVSLNGITTTVPFYTGTTLNDYPTDYDWYNLLSDILNGYEGIDKIIVGEETNQFTIVTFCGDDVINLNNENVTINMIINYDIGCFACNP